MTYLKQLVRRNALLTAKSLEKIKKVDAVFRIEMVKALADPPPPIKVKSKRSRSKKAGRKWQTWQT